jgi:asparagine synthase (glutamine-hydrolysing)
MLALFHARRPAPDGRTLFSGIRALPPAHALILDGEGARLERYWQPRPRPGLEHVDRREAATLVRDSVLDAVRRHGGGRPDAGVLLSGGLDSSTVLACAAIAAQGADAPVPQSFTGVFPEMPELDEQALARPLADRYGSPWTSVAVPAGPIVPDAVSYLSRWELPLEYPGGLFFRPVLEEAARRGVRVLLDGEGGDELFGCEPLLLADRVRSGDVRRALRLARALPGTTGRLDARRARVLARRWVLPGLLSPRLTVPLRRADPRSTGAPAWLREGPRATVSAALATDRCGWWSAGRPRWRAHLSWVLNDQVAAIGVHDHLRRITVPTGVADAHPLLDVRLIELALGLPPELAFDARLDRPVLRAAMAGLLPDEVRLRASKVYFDRLIVDALTGPDREAVDRTLAHGPLELGRLVDADRVRALWRAGPAGHPQGAPTWSAEVWRLFAAEAWLRREASG